MRIKPSFAVIIIGLTVLGGWGVWKIMSDDTPQTTISKRNSQEAFSEHQSTLFKKHTSTEKPINKTFNDDVIHVKQQLNQNQFTQAASYVNELYSDLNNAQLVVFKTLFINMGLLFSDNGNLKKAQRLYLASASLFDGVEILDLLSNVSIELKDWQTAFDALLKSSLLESRPEVISSKLSALVNVASQLKGVFLASSDLESARQLYQALYEAHPSYAQFQLELAYRHLALGDDNNAKQLFSAIQYDLDVGSIAKKQLALLEEQTPQIITQPEEVKKPNNDIRVSLLRIGNSFLVDSTVDGKKARLLLDTGASITALSPELISRLRLSPTGEIIRLSTANGITESPLFLVKKINLGSLTVRDLVVAEINFGSSQHFQGLLGTDLLNKVGTNYSYLIDNENNALIFRYKYR